MTHWLVAHCHLLPAYWLPGPLVTWYLFGLVLSATCLFDCRYIQSTETAIKVRDLEGPIKHKDGKPVVKPK
jgi:hypothetical protein